MTDIPRQKIADLRRQLAERDAELAAIAAWDMPYEGYGGHWGSNGERDYIRSVARGKPEWLARPKEPKP